MAIFWAITTDTVNLVHLKDRETGEWAGTYRQEKGKRFDYATYPEDKFYHYTHLDYLESTGEFR